MGIRPFAASCLAVFLVVLSLATLLVSCESNNPPTLIISGTVHVYRTMAPPANYPGSDFIGVIEPKDQVKVVEVVRKANYTAVRVRLNDGREGWVFSGEGIELR